MCGIWFGSTSAYLSEMSESRRTWLRKRRWAGRGRPGDENSHIKPHMKFKGNLGNWSLRPNRSTIGRVRQDRSQENRCFQFRLLSCEPQIVCLFVHTFQLPVSTDYKWNYVLNYVELYTVCFLKIGSILLNLLTGMLILHFPYFVTYSWVSCNWSIE